MPHQHFPFHWPQKPITHEEDATVKVVKHIVGSILNNTMVKNNTNLGDYEDSGLTTPLDSYEDVEDTSTTVSTVLKDLARTTTEKLATTVGDSEEVKDAATEATKLLSKTTPKIRGIVTESVTNATNMLNETTTKISEIVTNATSSVEEAITTTVKTLADTFGQGNSNETTQPPTLNVTSNANSTIIQEITNAVTQSIQVTFNTTGDGSSEMFNSSSDVVTEASSTIVSVIKNDSFNENTTEKILTYAAETTTQIITETHHKANNVNTQTIYLVLGIILALLLVLLLVIFGVYKVHSKRKNKCRTYDVTQLREVSTSTMKSGATDETFSPK